MNIHKYCHFVINIALGNRSFTHRLRMRTKFKFNSIVIFVVLTRAVTSPSSMLKRTQSNVKKHTLR